MDIKQSSTAVAVVTVAVCASSDTVTAVTPATAFSAASSQSWPRLRPPPQHRGYTETPPRILGKVNLVDSFCTPIYSIYSSAFFGLPLPATREIMGVAPPSAEYFADGRAVGRQGGGAGQVELEPLAMGPAPLLALRDERRRPRSSLDGEHRRNRPPLAFEL